MSLLFQNCRLRRKEDLRDKKGIYTDEEIIRRVGPRLPLVIGEGRVLVKNERRTEYF